MTKEEMLLLQQMMENTIDSKLQRMEQSIDGKFDAIRAEMQDMRSELNAKIDDKSAQMMMQFAEMLENQTTQMSMRYEHEVSGRINALDEETDILRDDVKDHEQRIHNVERKIGMAI